MLERTCRRPVTANWAIEAVLTRASVHNSFIVTQSFMDLVLDDVTMLVNLSLGPCHRSPALNPSSSSQWRKVSAVHVPSRPRSTGKHAARDVLLAAQHERWIVLPNHQRTSDDFPGTSRMSASYGVAKRET